MPKAKATVETAPELVSDAALPEVVNEVIVEQTGPRYGEFKDLEGRTHEVELVEYGTKFAYPGGLKAAPLEDYFFTENGKSPYDVVTKQRIKGLGFPVTSDTLITIFNDKFKPEDGFLLYKEELQDVYIVIVPKKFTKMSLVNGNTDGDIQIHALSFMGLGSVNIELFKSGLDKIAKNIGYTK